MRELQISSRLFHQTFQLFYLFLHIKVINLKMFLVFLSLNYINWYVSNERCYVVSKTCENI